jgi:hypothetical protein
VERATRVGLVEPGEHLDEGRLPRAVLPEETVDLPGEDVEVDGVEHPDAGEGLRDVPGLDHREEVLHNR